MTFNFLKNLKFILKKTKHDYLIFKSYLNLISGEFLDYCKGLYLYKYDDNFYILNSKKRCVFIIYFN